MKVFIQVGQDFSDLSFDEWCNALSHK